MKTTAIPLLGYALLGLLHQKERSGYDLRKVFAETAMGNYSSSPGAIYPALERLEAGKLIRGKVEEAGGLRRRCVYRLSPTGLAELKKWLSRPIERKNVLRGGPEVMLRFAFLARALGPEAAVSFLRDFGAVLKEYADGLQSYLRDNGASMPLSGRLALESGIRGYCGLHEWTNYAIGEYRKSQSKRASRPSKRTQGGGR